ncbi:MAG: ribosome biogenesis GTPase Der [Planctomycetes bacterium]|nr:ribosome biogenesis GTPase Der [Planctomycetota bacterium]
MKLPVVAIVGRPNVGKSSLLNCLARERISIVESTPGVTRDRVSAIIAHRDVTMEVVDTGGIGIIDEADLSEHIERQIEFAVRGANLIILVTDVREGVMPLDREVAQRLRPRAEEIPLILAANKVDCSRFEDEVGDLYKLGLGEPLPVSAVEGYGRQALLDLVVEKLWPTGDVDVEPVLKLAVVGRQNVGKSTFVNSLAREERVIVSELPGTTRDAVDVRFEKDGREFVIIDTAGVQRRKSIKDSISFYSQTRTDAAIRRADVILFLLDASQPITRADKKLAEVITRGHRTCVIVANKWDLVKDHAATGQYGEYLRQLMPGLHYAPIVFTTARDSKNIQAAVDLAQHLFKVASTRVGTGELNRVVEAIRDYQRPRVQRSQVARIYYATQVAVCPPTFVFFVNEPKLFSSSYRRYVENSMREAFPFDEVPIRIFFRRRESIYHD